MATDKFKCMHMVKVVTAVDTQQLQLEGAIELKLNTPTLTAARSSSALMVPLFLARILALMAAIFSTERASLME